MYLDMKINSSIEFNYKRTLKIIRKYCPYKIKAVLIMLISRNLTDLCIAKKR